MRRLFCLLSVAVFVLLAAPSTEATYVTMAQFDLNGDGEDEIIRTEGIAGETTVKIYEPIRKSYFFEPVKEIKVTGSLVQIPDVVDLTGDKILDFYFATGSDIGVIFYDTIDAEYKRENEVDAQMKPASPSVQRSSEKRLRLEDAESDFYMGLEKTDQAEDEDSYFSPWKQPSHGIAFEAKGS